MKRKLSNEDLKIFLKNMFEKGIAVNVYMEGNKDMILEFPKNKDGTQVKCAVNVDDIEVIKGKQNKKDLKSTSAHSVKDDYNKRVLEIIQKRMNAYK